MKQIEHLPAVVLRATLVPPCLTLRPEKFGRAGRVPLARLDGKQTMRAKPPGGCLLPFVPARASPVRLNVPKGHRHDDET
jgi:hypothetical protein